MGDDRQAGARCVYAQWTNDFRQRLVDSSSELPRLQHNLHRVRKNIPNINACHSKKGIIFGTNISGTNGHQMTGHFNTSPNVCFCTTRGKLNQRNMG